jgi:hypothetical protein
LHEFLPNQVELAVEVALGESRGEDVAEHKRVLQKVNELHEATPCSACAASGWAS